MTTLTAECPRCDGELVLLVDAHGMSWIGRGGLFMCHCETCGVVGVHDERIVEQARHVPMSSRRFWVQDVAK